MSGVVQHGLLEAMFLGLCASSLPLAGGAQGRPPVTTRDSAGIRIVENHAPAWPDGRGWRFSEKPVLQIGTALGDTTTELANTTHALRLSDGRIVVSQSNHLKVFDSRGRFVRQIGRKGQGPGEFDAFWLNLVPLSGDTMAVVGAQDPMIFDPQGEFVGYVRVPVQSFGIATDHGPGSRLLQADGSVILILIERSRPRDPGLFTRSQYYTRWVPGSDGLDTLGRHVFWRGQRRDGRDDFVPFTWGALHGGRGDRFYIGDPVKYEIHGYTLPPRRAGVPQKGATRPSMIVRLGKPLRPVTARDRADFSNDRVSRARPEFRPQEQRWLAGVEWPATHLAFVSVMADRAGNLWVGELRAGEKTRNFATSGTQIPTLFSVFDRTGRYLGEVPIPSGVEVLDIGDDYVLGVWKDAEDVQYVRLYSLLKPSAR